MNHEAERNATPKAPSKGPRGEIAAGNLQPGICASAWRDGKHVRMSGWTGLYVGRLIREMRRMHVIDDHENAWYNNRNLA